MKKYVVTYKVKGEKIWCEECLKKVEVVAKTKKEAREKTFDIICQYHYTIVSIDLI